jgi:spermidine synthase
MRRSFRDTLFFLSGASALIYELVWQRLLNLVFGNSTLAVSAVLAAFMGGLALGGLVFGRRADRTPHPWRLYAVIEAAIALVGLAVPVGFTLITQAYTAMHATWQPAPWAGALVRFGFAIVVLAPPATLIGGTLPVMARLALRPACGQALVFSRLYAVNTLGAGVGAGLTGFVFLHYLGMQETLWIAAGINGVAALSAVVLGVIQSDDRHGAAATLSPPVTLESDSHPSRARMRLVLLCAGLCGATGMGLEVVWARILGILTSNSAYGFALLLTVLLGGLVMGSWLQSIWLRRAGDRWTRLAVCQWLLAAVVLVAQPFYGSAPAWFERCCEGGRVPTILAGEFALAAGLVLVPAVLMGMALPLFLAGVASNPGRFGRSLGRFYAANTLGSVVGPFLTGFILIPWLGIHAVVGLLSACSVLVGIAAWLLAERMHVAWRGVAGTGVMAAAVAGWLALPRGGYHKSPVEPPRRLLFYEEGNNATVSIIEDPDGVRTILVDGQPVAGTLPTSIVDQKMLAHLPLLLHPAPHRALTVGFGSGGTSHSMMLHGVDVDCVEIEGRVPAAAGCFLSENGGILSAPRYRLIVDDVRSWLRVAPGRYDVIATDCTNIQYRSNGDLYTVDYFRLMKDRLAENGLAAAWVPTNGIREADLKTLLRSFQHVFAYTTVWYMNTLPTDFLIVVGTPQPLSIDLQELGRRMAKPTVAADLAAVGFENPERLLYTFLAGERALAAYVGSGPLHTDDRPVLSYSTYGASFQPTAPANLLRLLACRSDAAQLVQQPGSEATMLRHYAASNELVMGHIAHQVGAEKGALVHYLRGAQLLPADPAVKQLVRLAYRHLEEKGKASEESEAPPAPAP